MAVQDIKIVGMDEGASGPSGRGALDNIVLKLSPQPDNQWVEIFEHMWRTNFSMTKRTVSIYGSNLTVECMKEELQHQIDELKGVFAKANELYRTQMEEAEANARREAADALAERQRLADLSKNLKF